MSEQSKDDRTEEEKFSARLMGEIYDRRNKGESWTNIATWLKGVKETK